MKVIRKMSILTPACLLILGSSSSFSDTDKDNTEINKRDRATTQLTADQQSMSGSDTEITRRIRQDLMQNKDLSTYAQNVKIITIDGRVTLKGPVNSKEEENILLKSARSVVGATRVTNKLEIARAK